MKVLFPLLKYLIKTYFIFRTKTLAFSKKKEQKRTQELMDSMEIGDYVLTTSGFYGVLIDISDDDVIVEFGNNKNCRISMQKKAIAQVEKPSDSTSAE